MFYGNVYKIMSLVDNNVDAVSLNDRKRIIYKPVSLVMTMLMKMMVMIMMITTRISPRTSQPIIIIIIITCKL